MAKSSASNGGKNASGGGKSDSGGGRLVQLRKKDAAAKAGDTGVHVYGNNVRCDTEARGYPTPQNLSPLELVLDASEGFVPLWEQGVTLRWKFRNSSFNSFQNPAALKAEVRKLFAQALLAWGDAAPIAFTEKKDVWDFEIIMSPNPNCDINGCVLARAFFPDGGRHDLTIWPTMFEQDPAERVETMCHEIGHIYGLRHFFAQTRETGSPSVLFGKQNAFTIMNYGAKSRLTQDDRDDLARLYRDAWSGDLTEVNGTPIRFVRPYHTLAGSADNRLAANLCEPAVPVLRRAAAYRRM
jgi:hypothetical protein